jgi:iron complex transport system substrate-binding protein
LGKAEWIKLFGYLTGKEKEANAYFKKIAQEYNELRTIGQKFSSRPSVFSGNAYGDIWFCPAGESFNAKLIDDAGGQYTYKSTKGTGSLELSPEKVFYDNIQTTYWLNPGISTLQDLIRSNPKAEHYNAYKESKVYCYSPNMNYFWEMSAIEPQLVLSDLLTIFHPGSTSGKLHFYQMIH